VDRPGIVLIEQHDENIERTVTRSLTSMPRCQEETGFCRFSLIRLKTDNDLR
jgi:hypothetical protein